MSQKIEMNCEERLWRRRWKKKEKRDLSRQHVSMRHRRAARTDLQRQGSHIAAKKSIICVHVNYIWYSSQLSLHSRVPFTRVFINFIRAISRR